MIKMESWQRYSGRGFGVLAQNFAPAVPLSTLRTPAKWIKRRFCYVDLVSGFKFSFLNFQIFSLRNYSPIEYFQFWVHIQKDFREAKAVWQLDFHIVSYFELVEFDLFDVAVGSRLIAERLVSMPQLPIIITAHAFLSTPMQFAWLNFETSLLNCYAKPLSIIPVKKRGYYKTSFLRLCCWKDNAFEIRLRLKSTLCLHWQWVFPNLHLIERVGYWNLY